ncbi:hypothetical protein BDW74DRAFT_34456 [Aspergillus multicolor]|uniref:uncharacterized protein n=1 Tax=Aspergillus multicolor TaxID=41759 RepID=UPI003CCCD38C
MTSQTALINNHDSASQTDVFPAIIIVGGLVRMVEPNRTIHSHRQLTLAASRQLPVISSPSTCRIRWSSIHGLHTGACSCGEIIAGVFERFMVYTSRPKSRDTRQMIRLRSRITLSDCYPSKALGRFAENVTAKEDASCWFGVEEGLVLNGEAKL